PIDMPIEPIIHPMYAVEPMPRDIKGPVDPDGIMDKLMVIQKQTANLGQLKAAGIKIVSQIADTAKSMPDNNVK
ncbi:MAG: hypothetical protein PHS37_09870, partial [Candidatus Omnitrophica bacterium]|nr:hypothetical protein [Candidatus Omnitrophota bacterium]